MYYSAQLQLPDSMSKSEKKEIADITIKEMGLEDAMDTRIGGSGAKGISSGQKRRVSICIEILTRPKLLFLDEPTSGLDSAASYYVMSRIASLHKGDGITRTIIASIHQPSNEVFQVFHNLCLLSSGRTVYFGPSSTATEVSSLMFLMSMRNKMILETQYYSFSELLTCPIIIGATSISPNPPFLLCTNHNRLYQ